MKHLKYIVAAAIGMIIFTMSVYANDVAKDFTLKDSYGKKHSLHDYQGKWVVLEWTNFGCPFVKKHYLSKNMQQLQKKYTAKSVIWLSICSSGPEKQGNYENMDDLNEHIAKHESHETAYLIDEEGTAGTLYGAQTTPHMMIISPEGKIVYNGAIDDIKSTDVEDVKNAKNYISEVLDAVLSGKPSPISKTKPYGCSVKYK